MNEWLGPLYFEPVYQSYVWGGDRIPRVFRRPLPPGTYAESWEISTRPEGMSVVADGPFKGKTLQELVQAYGVRLLGKRYANKPFPFLFKLIDARERLSLQVHPSEKTAPLLGGEAKTELWYILDTEPGAGVFAGFQPGVDRAAFEQALENENCEPVLQRHAVEPDDAVFIPGGMVHAIDAGCLLCEIQQNSNTTYRVYDWGRVGKDGKPRETHREKAMAAMNFQPSNDAPLCQPVPLPPQGGSRRTRLHDSSLFRIDRINVQTRWAPADTNKDFEIWFVLRGQGMIQWTGDSKPFSDGMSFLIPAETKGLCFLPEEPHSALLRIRPGEPENASGTPARKGQPAT